MPHISANCRLKRRRVIGPVKGAGDEACNQLLAQEQADWLADDAL